MAASDSNAMAASDSTAPAIAHAPPTSVSSTPEARAEAQPAPKPATKPAPNPSPVTAPGVEVGAAPAGAAPEPRTAWPDADWRSERQALPPKAGAQPSPGPRRDNALVTGLVRAMRDAARATRDEAVTSLRTAAAERTQEMRAESTAAAANLRKIADADVAAIREWSKAEMARVREETDARIAERRARLATETEDEGRAGEARLAALGEAIQQYEAETAAFFEALLAEEDPARLAGLAERMPAPPPLDVFGSADAGDAVMSSRPRSPRGSPRPSAGSAITSTDAAASRKTRPAEHVAATEAAAAHAAGPVDAATDPEASEPEPTQSAEPTQSVEPEALDPDAAAAAEAEALAGLDGQTQLIVSGLTSVASIATFKAALVRSPGVNAVSVTAGSDGDCMFTVTHAGDADLRDALRDIEPFQTRLIADDGSTLVVVAHEPAA
jgi:hypothetical protein